MPAAARLVYILIDPDGYVYDQTLVDAGSTITTSLVSNAVITAYVWLNDAWQVWPVTGGGPVGLAAGGSAEIEIAVAIPASAPDGLTDVTTLTVRSQYDPSVSATAGDQVTVVIEQYTLFLPVIKKQPATGVLGNRIGRR